MKGNERKEPQRYSRDRIFLGDINFIKKKKERKKKKRKRKRERKEEGGGEKRRKKKVRLERRNNIQL